MSGGKPPVPGSPVAPKQMNVAPAPPIGVIPPTASSMVSNTFPQPQAKTTTPEKS
jgi:hypothetical protein